MALVNSGAIQLGIPADQPANRNISSEFGDTPGADSISEYYRGGSYVPNNATNVPTSGQISFSNFYGTSAYTPVSANISNRFGFGVDCGRPYIISITTTTNLSVSGGNGSYTYDWDGPNAFSGPALATFRNIDNQTASNVNLFANNNSVNFSGEWTRTATYTINVSDGTTSVNRSFTFGANFNQGCR
jgi:hypothetical protein